MCTYMDMLTRTAAIVTSPERGAELTLCYNCKVATGDGQQNLTGDNGCVDDLLKTNVSSAAIDVVAWST